jgi:anti-sigma28 factor (negative regulator of flagellin synthesis)
LKEAIASGNYRIDLGAIADGVIRFGSKSPG